MIERLDRWATGRTALTAFATALGCLVAANVFATWFFDRAGGHGMLDLAGARNSLSRPGGYTPADAYALIEAWGPEGRPAHLAFTLTGDLLLPPTMFLALSLALLYAGNRLRMPARWRGALVALPAAYLACDYLENLGIVTALLIYPRRSDPLLAATNTLMQAKNLTSTLAVLATIALLAVLAVKRPARNDPQVQNWPPGKGR